MKICILSVLYFTLFITSSFANVCGLLELEDGSLLEINRGQVYDLSGNLLTSAVPVSKKVLVANDLGQGMIQSSKSKSKKSKRVTKQIKIEFTLNSGKKLSAVVNQEGSLVFFDSAANNFVLIKINDSVVARASFSESSNKLKFIENDNEFFSKDSCNNF